MLDNAYKLSHFKYLKIALPFMLSMLTQPLLGVVDTAVVGQLESPIFIAGVSIGTTIFNTIYWIFGFLRVSTTSYSAQSVGSKNNKDKLEAFIHPFIMAFIIGVLLVILQKPLWIMAMKILSPENLVKEQASIYYFTLIIGAPFVLVNYVILGWLMGQSKVKESVIMQVIGNLINIILDIILVKVFNMNVLGVALATLTSQVITTIIGTVVMVKCSGLKKEDIFNKSIWNKKDVVRELLVSRDFIIRTICLLIVNNMFMATSSTLGTVVLASNTIILQFESIISYIFEGLANASSIFSGKAIGDRNNKLLQLTIIRTLQWSIVVMVSLTIGYILIRERILFLFTNIDEVIQCVKTYDSWIIIYPSVACLGLTFYGVFSGAMATKAIRNSTFISMVIFMIACKISIPNFGNHGLWLSFITYYFSRTIFLIIYLKSLYIEEETEFIDNV